MRKRLFGKLLCGTLLAAFSLTSFCSTCEASNLLAIRFGPGPGGGDNKDQDKKASEKIEEDLDVTGVEGEEGDNTQSQESSTLENEL